MTLYEQVEKVGTFLSNMAKLIFEAAQVALTIAAFGFAALITENSKMDLLTNFLLVIGTVYIAWTFASKFGEFIGSFFLTRGLPVFAWITMASAVATFTGAAGYLIFSSSVEITNALLVAMA